MAKFLISRTCNVNNIGCHFKTKVILKFYEGDLKNGEDFLTKLGFFLLYYDKKRM